MVNRVYENKTRKNILNKLSASVCILLPIHCDIECGIRKTFTKHHQEKVQANVDVNNITEQHRPVTVSNFLKTLGLIFPLLNYLLE